MKNIPPLNSTYPLSEEQIQFYEENGFCFLKQVFSEEEVEVYREIIDAAVHARSGHDTRSLAEKSFYERVFTQCGHLWSEFPGVKQFTTSSRLANIARQFFRNQAR